MKTHNMLPSRHPKVRATLVRGLFYFFLVGGLWGLGCATFAVLDARAYQAIALSNLPKLSNLPRTSPARVSRVVAEGELVGEIDIPSLELKIAVVQGESSKILRRAVGHLPATALPGDPGNVVLAGHRDTFFRPLRNIQVGDAIAIVTPDGKFEYQVESTEVVSPEDVQALQSTGENTLTLITCFPFYYVGPAPKRFIVRARQTEDRPQQPVTGLASDQS